MKKKGEIDPRPMRPAMGKRMEAGFKAFRNGTHRTVSPADTLARVRPLMGTMGITRVANVTGLD